MESFEYIGMYCESLVESVNGMKISDGKTIIIETTRNVFNFLRLPPLHDNLMNY
jgi:hypothetical protein